MSHSILERFVVGYGLGNAGLAAPDAKEHVLGCSGCADHPISRKHSKLGHTIIVKHNFENLVFLWNHRPLRAK